MSEMAPLLDQNDQVLDTIKITQEYLTELVNDCSSFCITTECAESQWYNRTSRLIVSLNSFIEITSLLYRYINHLSLQKIPEIKESHINLFFIIKAIDQATSRKDKLAVEELIKYELKDNLIQWKIDLIPQIKKRLNY